MGANQSKGQQDDAEPSAFCGCGARRAAPSSDFSDNELKSVPSKQLRISHGQVQPVRRSKMSVLGGRPDSMAAPPARHLSERRAAKRRPASRAKVNSTQSPQDVVPPLPALHAPADRQSTLSPNYDAGAGADDALPQNKRLSPMPDFASFDPEEVDQLASTPWVAVRQMAERMPSRRSSALAPPHNSPPLGSNRTSLPRQRTSQTSAGPTQLSPTLLEQRKAPQASGSSEKLPRLGADQAANLRIRTKFDVPDAVPMPLQSAKSVADSFDTTRVHAPSTRQPSPKLRSAKPYPLKSAMKQVRKGGQISPLVSPTSKSTVEDAVRELQEIVEAKRAGGGSFDTVRSGSTFQSKRASEQPKHRAAIAPSMALSASSGLLDEIGSAFSRPASGQTLASQFRDDGTPASPPSSIRQAGALPKRMQKWKMLKSSSAGGSESSARHSGTFFFGGPTSRPTTPTAKSPTANAGDESPVDTNWDSDRPFSDEIAPGTVDVRASLAVPPVKRASARPRLSRSSSIAVANPVSHLSSISSLRDGDESASSFSFIDADAAASQSSTSRPRADHSAAVQAARSRARLRTPTGDGLGLGIGGVRASRDDSSLIDIKKEWGTKPLNTWYNAFAGASSPIRAPGSPVTALPPVGSAAAEAWPTPARGLTKPARALAGVVRRDASVQQNEARPRQQQQQQQQRDGQSAVRPSGLSTVGEDRPMRLTAADVQRNASARRMMEMELGLERLEMERGLQRLSQVGVAM